MRRALWLVLPVLLVVAGLSAPPADAAVSCDTASYPSVTWTACELANATVSTQNVLGHPDLLAGIGRATQAHQVAKLKALLADPERHPDPNSCTTVLVCPVDPRTTEWTAQGGLVEPVLYTSRSGATMSGHVWATRAGAASRPGVVVINGSIVGFDEAYQFLAQALARAGFVVMTFDPQGEGMSDQLGEAPDQLEDAFAGIPGLGILGPTDVTGDRFGGGNGLTFYDGGQDALDFFLSTPAHPYVPRPSRTTGTSHAAKQHRRVAAGLDNAFNPLWQLLDRDRIGVTGHSYGAEAASWLAQADPRVGAAVALDNLCVPVDPSPDEVQALAQPNPDFGGPGVLHGLTRDCFGAPPGPAPRITKPALGITSDYLLTVAPYLRPPNPLGKSRASLVYSAAGVDSGSIIVRGGTHYEFDDVPLALPATLRGLDMASWYTVAWFRKYLAGDPGADAMLLTDRWRSDAAAGRLDPLRDANMFSWHFDSRLDVHLAGGAPYDCEDLRARCAGQTPKTADGGPVSYSAF